MSDDLSQHIPDSIKIVIVIEDRITGHELVDLFDALKILPKKYNWAIKRGLLTEEEKAKLNK